MKRFSLRSWSKQLWRRVAAPRPVRRQVRHWPGACVAAEVLELRVLLSAQVLGPADEASISDTNLDGRGDTFNAAPFTGLLRQTTTIEDRAIAEFDVAQFAGVDSATLDFNIAVNNSFGGPTRTYGIYLYSGNRQADLVDYSVPGTQVGTVTLVIANNDTDYRLDVTNAVRSLVTAGATAVGVRVDPVDNSSPSIFRNSLLTVDGGTVGTNQPPTIDDQAFSIAENSATGSVIGQVLAAEPDSGQSLTFAITTGNEAGLFVIDPNNGNLTVADGSRLDFETARNHQLTVTVTDNGSPALSDSAAVTISVVDQNDNAPTITAGQTIVVAEDATNGTPVGTVRVTDPDTVSGTRNFSIVGGNDDGIFVIDAVSGAISVGDETFLDFDLAQSHVLSLQVSDGVNLSAVQTVTINVEPLPAETVLQPVIRASIHDQPRDGVGDSFNQEPFTGLLRQVEGVSGSLEDRAIVEFDLAGLGSVVGGTIDLHLAVNNSFGGGTRTFAVLVYAGNGQADLGDYSSSATQVAQVTLVVSEQSGFYTINAANAVRDVLRSGTTWVGLRVDPVDDSAPSILVDATLTVNAAPTLAPLPQAITIAEDAGTQTIGLAGITAGGREDQPLQVTAVSSNPALIANPVVTYASGDSSGQIAFAAAANASGTATITITVTDAGIDRVFGTGDENTFTRHVFVTVTPVNDPPVIADQSFSVLENSPAGTAVGTVAATDPENQGLTYAIVAGNTGNAFAINPNTGAVTVANASALDFETTPVFQLTVQATDKGTPNLSATAVVTISLLDVKEPIPVGLDIDVGDSSNTIDINKPGKIEVAIFSTATFDARRVDVGSLTFGRTGFEDSLTRNKRGLLTYRYADLNGDGLLDLAATFDVAGMGFQLGDTLGILRGLTLDGDEIVGQQSVTIVSGGGRGGKKN